VYQCVWATSQHEAEISRRRSSWDYAHCGSEGSLFGGSQREQSRPCHWRYFLLLFLCLALYRPVVKICTGQWSLYVPQSGHYMYRTVVTICTARWSLYVPHGGHYMYRTVVIICTAQWSLYVPHGGHYMYRTVVTICTAQWSLYVPLV